MKKKVKLVYLNENIKETKKLMVISYENFEKVSNEMGFYKMAFQNVCDNQDDCESCPYKKYEEEDKCFNEYLRENNPEIELDI